MKTKKILKFLLWSFVAVVTLVGLLYAWVDWSGTRAWKKTEAELLAKGEPTRLEDIIPPPIPDEQNFAFSPFFEGVFETETLTENGKLVHRPKHPEAIERLDNLRLPRNPKSPRLPHTVRSEPTDIVAWQTYLRANPEFGLTEDVPSPAVDVVEAFGNWKAPLDEIAGDLRERPQMRAPLHYEHGMVPHFSGTTNLARLYQLRAIARIRQGRSSDAFTDLESLFLLRNVVEPHQTVVGNITATAITPLALTVLREGVAAHTWDEDQLINLSLKLERLNPFADFSSALRSERAFALDAMRRMPEDYQEKTAFLKMTWWEKIAVGALLSTPRGFWEQDRAAYGRLMQQLLEEVLSQEQERMDVSAYRDLTAELARPKGFPAWIIAPTSMASMALQVLSPVSIKTAEVSAYIDQGRIAIALERHRAQHGNIPDNLTALVPEFLAQVPHDPIDGKPLRYQKISESDYRIWSIGYDGKDDGGLAGEKNNTEGDWVWESLPPFQATQKGAEDGSSSLSAAMTPRGWKQLLALEDKRFATVCAILPH